jgi:hypothetical protein
VIPDDLICVLLFATGKRSAVQGDFIEFICEPPLGTCPAHAFKPLAECSRNGLGLGLTSELRELAGEFLCFFAADAQGHDSPRSAKSLGNTTDGTPMARPRFGAATTSAEKPWEIGGNSSSAPPHFQAFSCNDRPPEVNEINALNVTARTHNAGVEGSSPSLSIIKSKGYVKSICVA